MPSVRAELDGRGAVLLAAVLSMAAVFWVWGASLAPVPVMHDEWAYWMQADQYGHLHWSVPAPAVPEFFEQFYVLVTPVFAAKYPPGHALLMAPGSLLGVPALVPLLLTGATGALVFVLARRLAGGAVGALTFALWLGSFGNLRFRAAYFSETTTGCCWLVAWWALLEWRTAPAGKRLRWMLLLAVSIGIGAIARPATMFVFAIPVGVVVLRAAFSGRRWRELALGVVAGALVLAILPLWSLRTTGSWRETPLAVYTRQYLPFDVPGLTVSTAQPERALPAEMERTREFLREIKTVQANGSFVGTVGERTRMLLFDAFGGWRVVFAPLAVVGVLVAGGAAWFAVGTGLLLLLSYGTQAHTADWTVYYLETLPAFALLAALGGAWIVRRLRVEPRHSRLGGLLLTSLLGVALIRDVLVTRDTLDRIAAAPRRFRAALAMLPRSPNIVFVRYAERRSMHIALVANAGLLSEAPTWIVHDRGADNERLLAAAPNRAAYLLDESTGEIREMRR